MRIGIVRFFFCLFVCLFVGTWLEKWLCEDQAKVRLLFVVENWLRLLFVGGVLFLFFVLFFCFFFLFFVFFFLLVCGKLGKMVV